jgi:hypothetical protein
MGLNERITQIRFLDNACTNRSGALTKARVYVAREQYRYHDPAGPQCAQDFETRRVWKAIVDDDAG